MNKNKLNKLPINIEQIGTLNSLNLSDNNLGDFPMAVLNLAGLTKLYLDRNSLTSLPIASLKKWKSLALLSLDGNNFDEDHKVLIQDELNYWFGDI